MGPVACYRFLRDRPRRRAQVLAVRPGGRGRSASLRLAEVCAGSKGDEPAATITTRNRRERIQRGTGITASGRPGKMNVHQSWRGKVGTKWRGAFPHDHPTAKLVPMSAENTWF